MKICMNKRILINIVFAMTTFTDLQLYAAQTQVYDIKAGMWEITTTSDLLDLVPSLPAETMTNIKNLASEYGLDLPDVQNGAVISNTCVTPTMAKQKVLPDFYHHQTGCTTQSTTRNGNDFKLQFACHHDNLTGNGTAEVKVTSQESLTGQTAFKGLVQGSRINENAQIKGRWLSESCEPLTSN